MRRPVQPFLAFRVGALALGVCSSAALTSVANATPDPNVELGSRQKALENFPCDACHRNVDAAAEAKEGRPAHREIRVEHMKEMQRCEICHSKEDRNSLVLVGGSTLAIDASHDLCGQCHGEKRRDWNLNLHGKRVGSWNGKKQQYGCVDCHDPHVPKIAAVKAVPPPPFPRFGVRKAVH